MKLEEARKLATPGPVRFYYHSAAKARQENPGTDGGGSSGGLLYGDNVRGRNMAFMAINRDPAKDPQHKATAALLAHAYNMLPELVEAIEDVVMNGRSLAAIHNESTPCWVRLEKLLARAEDVPGI